MSNNGTGKNITWFLAGALLGSAAITLTTPWPGRRMRRLVRSKVEDGADQLARGAKGFRQAGDKLRYRATRLFA
jgi:hypothetical protein